jgi:hypothetical protein
MYIIFKPPPPKWQTKKNYTKKFLVNLIHDQRHCLCLTERLQLRSCSETERSEFLAGWEYILISELLYKKCGNLIYENGRCLKYGYNEPSQHVKTL